jgi:hypothetical protein
VSRPSVPGLSVFRLLRPAFPGLIFHFIIVESVIYWIK